MDQVYLDIRKHLEEEKRLPYVIKVERVGNIQYSLNETEKNIKGWIHVLVTKSISDSFQNSMERLESHLFFSASYPLTF